MTKPNGAMRGQAGGECGQMVVELAAVAPVMIALSLIALNLMLFIEASARFDRVVPDAVMAAAVSPASGEGSAHEHDVQAAIAQAMDGVSRIEVSVRAVGAWGADGTGAGFSFAPHLTRYICTMRYTPWPSALSVAGVEVGIPFSLDHERQFTVDRYRSGVVL